MQQSRAFSIIIGVLIVLWLSAALVRLRLHVTDSHRQTQVTHALK